jgi:hypothetical protein
MNVFWGAAHRSHEQLGIGNGFHQAMEKHKTFGNALMHK